MPAAEAGLGTLEGPGPTWTQDRSLTTRVARDLRTAGRRLGRDLGAGPCRPTAPEACRTSAATASDSRHVLAILTHGLTPLPSRAPRFLWREPMPGSLPLGGLSALAGDLASLLFTHRGEAASRVLGHHAVYVEAKMGPPDRVAPGGACRADSDQATRQHSDDGLTPSRRVRVVAGQDVLVDRCACRPGRALEREGAGMGCAPRWHQYEPMCTVRIDSQH
jgi:hypothetical protein